jgi:hypothetical protein
MYKHVGPPFRKRKPIRVIPGWSRIGKEWDELNPLQVI